MRPAFSADLDEWFASQRRHRATRVKIGDNVHAKAERASALAMREYALVRGLFAPRRDELDLIEALARASLAHARAAAVNSEAGYPAIAKQHSRIANDLIGDSYARRILFDRGVEHEVELFELMLWGVRLDALWFIVWTVVVPAVVLFGFLSEYAWR